MRGFIPILIVIPVAIISLATIVVATFNNNLPIVEQNPDSISRSVNQSPSSTISPSPLESPPSNDPSHSSSPSPDFDPKLDYQAIAKTAPSPSPIALAPSSTSSRW